MPIMGTCVKEVMTPDPMTLTPEATVGEAYTLMTSRGFRHVPIVENETLVGVISMTDVGVLGSKLPEILAKVLRDVMTTNLLTIGPDEPVDLAAAKMASRKINCLPVVQNSRLLGIVTTYDLLDALVRRLHGKE
jgi:acetoin utilization protein AcuB